MATPIRKKRNFKALQLDVKQPPAPPEPDPMPIPTRLAPVAAPATAGAKAKKRPPPMALKSTKGHSTPAGGDESLLLSSNVPTSAPASNAASSNRKSYHTTLSNTLANLDMNAETKYDLRDEDLKELQELGQGNGGSVKKVEHVPTHTTMAKKVLSFPFSTTGAVYVTVFQIVLIDAKPSVRKQILRELQIMHDCHSEYIISFYGAFLSDPNICICMEFSDKGSLDGIYKRIGPIDVEVVAKVARAVLEGLTYLYDVHRIIHRGIYSSFLAKLPTLR